MKEEISYQVVFNHPCWDQGTCSRDITYIEEKRKVTKKDIMDYFLGCEMNFNYQKINPKKASNIVVLKIVRTKEVIKL